MHRTLNNLMTPYKCSSLSVVLGLILIHPGTQIVHAAPVILYDNGQTLPIPHVPQTPPNMNTLAHPTALSFQGALNVLPISTPELSPGAVQTQTIERLHLRQPIFVIGADPRSLQWLQNYQKQLKAAEATGIVVNVETERELAVLRRAAGGLTLQPMSGKVLVERLGLAHYPVLISSTRIEQ